MDITFFQNKSDAKCITKDITYIKSVSGKLTDDTEVTTPSLLINGLYVEDVLPIANYAYITDWKRYYYVQGVEYHYNGFCRVDLVCDVLMSFRSEILESIGHFTRSTMYNPYAQTYDIEDKRDIDVKPFAFSFPAFPTMVLVTTKANYNEYYNGVG